MLYKTILLLLAAAMLAGASTSACRAARLPTMVRSIREWVKGDGKTDDAIGVAKAFDACKNNAFTLQVDCPVFIHVGTDIGRPIFVDDGANVRFTKDGLFIIDNVLEPGFVLANCADVRLLNWNVEYVGGLPIDRMAAGYYDNGTLFSNSYPAPKFNDLTLTAWLRDHRGIAFGKGAAISCMWYGPTNLSSMFYLIGPTNHVDIEDMKLFVPRDALGSQFIPMAFSMAAGYDSNTTPVAVAGDITRFTVPDIAVPSDLTFKNITLDGYYMGFQGTSQHSTFSHITGLRYGDLEDAAGNNVGGVGKWFAPPHLFYLNGGDSTHPYDDRLANRNVTISDVNDIGPRVGRARDSAQDIDPVSKRVKRSGYANSLKIGAVDSTVTNYISNRPDGLLDMLSCRNMTLTNITGTFDSSFINDLYPGVRFPSGDYYQNLTLKNVTLTDTAENPYARAPANERDPLPFSGATGPHNSNIVFKNVVVNLKRWSRPALQPVYSGPNNSTQITFNIGH